MSWTKVDYVRKAFEQLGTGAEMGTIQAHIKKTWPAAPYISVNVIAGVKSRMKKPARMGFVPPAVKLAEAPAPAVPPGRESLTPTEVSDVITPKAITVSFTRQEAWALIRSVEYHNADGECSKYEGDEAPAGWAATRLFKALVGKHLSE